MGCQLAFLKFFPKASEFFFILFKSMPAEEAKTIFRKYGIYYDTGSVPFQASQWHHLAASHDGDSITTYLDGEIFFQKEQSDPVFVEEGSLGIGGTADGGSLFNGWIDDLRFYNKALPDRNIARAWGMGMETLVQFLKFIVDRSPASMPLSMTVVFQDSNGDDMDVTGRMFY